jgi:bifunctional non-homologous end joining protein LigD
VYLANQGTITPHAWLSRVDRPRRPDRVVIDLDPPDTAEADLTLAKDGVRHVMDLLADVGLVPFVMTTGSRGFHVVAPVERRQDVNETRAFARDVAALVARRYPDRFTTAQRQEQRAGRLYLDTSRNAYGQTAVAPYAVRGRPGAPVATPLDRDELAAGDLTPRRYTLQNLFRRLGQRDDPWREIGATARPLGEPRDRLHRLAASADRPSS